MPHPIPSKALAHMLGHEGLPRPNITVFRHVANVKCGTCENKQKAPSTKLLQLGMVAHVFNPNTQDAKVGRSE